MVVVCDTLGGVAVPGWLASNDAVRHSHHEDASPGERADWPSWLDPALVAHIRDTGIPQPWRHQREFADLAFSGCHCAITTGTASGKTLAYLMPVLAATAPGGGVIGWEPASVRARLEPHRHTALYLAPTKALAHDQLRAATAMGPAGWAVTTLDGDSDPGERRFARDHATFVLTNPDMLHRSVLPAHVRWARLLGSLRYVVIDEAHRYRGVFGAHVSAVLRRLRRLCHRYGSDPVFLLASATATDAAHTGGLLIGEPDLGVVDLDTSAHPGRDTVLWQPQGSATDDAAGLLAALTREGRQTIAFVPSRKHAELVAAAARERSGAPILSYRSGYLPEERRRIERELTTGTIRGVAATNALELGIDVSGMDAVVIAGFPGTLASLRQQAGRAGRADRDALVVLVAREDPLDAYLFDHPALLFDDPVERTVLYPENPRVLGPHLAAAAQESPLTPEDVRWFGPTMPTLVEQLVGAGLLRRRPTGWFWTRPDRAVDAIDLRSAGDQALEIIDSGTGRIVGEVDAAASDRVVHPGAVYLHLGEQWLVDRYAPDEHQALVHRVEVNYYTQPRSTEDIRILDEEDSAPLGRTTIHTGDVEISTRVVAYLRRDERTHDVWDQTPLDLPVRTLRTQATWWTVPPEVVAELALTPAELAGGAHGAEHTSIGLLPAFVPCDRWDIGGLSTLLHPDTGTCTVFVHDGLPGGAGFARRGFDAAPQWLEATRQRLHTCRCTDGCPSCVVSPKCGNANQMLDKGAATAILDALLLG